MPYQGGITFFFFLFFVFLEGNIALNILVASIDPDENNDNLAIEYCTIILAWTMLNQDMLLRKTNDINTNISDITASSSQPVSNMLLSLLFS